MSAGDKYLGFDGSETWKPPSLFESMSNVTLLLESIESSKETFCVWSVESVFCTGNLGLPKGVVLLPVAGMSEIRDRAQPAPVKSRKFRDNGLPVSG
jgi:hypothetical protein